MMRSIVSLALVGALADPAHGEPCTVTIARAPDDVREEIDRWLRDEPRCAGTLEVRVIPGPDGLYLFARDGRGFTRARTVPDASSAAALIASWAADDSVDGVWIPTPPRPLPPPMDMPPVPQAERGAGLRWSGIATGAAGVVAIAAGAYFGMRASQISSQIDAHSPTQPWPEDIHQLEARGQSYETDEKVLLTTGSALVVTGAVLYLVGHARAESVGVTTARGGGAVTWTARF